MWSSEHLLVGCLLDARDALVPSEVPALTMFTGYPASLSEQHTSHNQAVCVPQPNLAHLTHFIQVSMNREMQMGFPELK